MPIDDISLNINQTGQLVLSGALAFIMFGVALELRLADFIDVFRRPLVPISGLVTQIILLPALTLAVTYILDPLPSVAFGMIVVAACPGGNLSNLMTYLARGNVALSVSMSGVSNLLAVVTMPLNILFWSNLNPNTAKLLHDVSIEPANFFAATALQLGLPLLLGMLVANFLPRVAARLQRPFQILSFLFLIGFILAAGIANAGIFANFLRAVMPVVVLHNFAAIALGYGNAKIWRLNRRDTSAMTIEVNMHNSGLGLALILTQFDGIGGAALVAAGWGIWHIVSGGALAALWARASRADMASARAPTRIL